MEDGQIEAEFKMSCHHQVECRMNEFESDWTSLSQSQGVRVSLREEKKVFANGMAESIMARIQDGRIQDGHIAIEFLQNGWIQDGRIQDGAIIKLIRLN